MDPVLTAVGLGGILGFQHATDPDHLVAVATIATRQRGFRDAALVGVLWGAGHMLTLTGASAVVILLGLTVPPRLAAGLELVVAALLLGLGAARIRDATHGLRTVELEHLVADHDHGEVEGLHSHFHAHGEGMHAHPHVHPSRRLRAVLEAERGRLAVRALTVGGAHGLAGSAAVSLLVVATLGAAGGGVAAYLVAFAVGSLVGMTAFTAALAGPLAWALRWRPAQRLVSASVGLGAIAFGAVYAFRIF